jgi:hypothetical protein
MLPYVIVIVMIVIVIVWLGLVVAFCCHTSHFSQACRLFFVFDSSADWLVGGLIAQ